MSRELIANRRGGRWRVRVGDKVEGKRVGWVDTVRLHQKEAEKVGVDGDAIAIDRIINDYWLGFHLKRDV